MDKLINNIPVANVGGITRNATAILANIRVFNAQNGGFISAYPTGAPIPNTSSVNWYVGGAREVVNFSVISVSPAGFISLTGGGNTDYVIEVFGHIDDNASGGVYRPVTGNRFRIYDSRPSGTNFPDPPFGVGAGTFSSGQAARTIPIRGQLGIPNSSTVTGVIVNVTASNQPPSGGGYFAPFINGSAPNVKLVHWDTLSGNVARDVANVVFLELNGAGAIQIASGGGTAHLIVDIQGYIESPSGSANAGLFFPLENPARLYDSRTTEPVYPGSTVKGLLGAGQTRTITARNVVNVPVGTTSIVLRITTANPTGGLFLAMYPDGGWPGNSNVNTTGAGQQIANLAFVGISGSGNITVYNGHPVNSTNFILDVVGFLAGTNTSPYLGPLAWPNDYAGNFYWDGSVPSALNVDIERGMATWNNAPYRSPVFTRTNAPIVGTTPKIYFTYDDAAVLCGQFRAVACMELNINARYWQIGFNSFYDFISESDPDNPVSFVIGHVMNHEYGHVFTLNHNDVNSAGATYTYNSILPTNVNRSNDRINGVVRPRGSGDNQALYNRYGSR
jgi:hypothetical protein